MTRPAHALLLVLAVAAACLGTASARLRAAPKLLKPVVRPRVAPLLGAAAAGLSDKDCQGKAARCEDCTTVLTCRKMAASYFAINSTTCGASLPYCSNGACVATVPDESCNNAPDLVTSFTCTSDGVGYFPSLSDCKKYYLCSDKKAYEYDCTPYKNTLYSHARAMCVPTSEAQCATVTCTAAMVGAYQVWSTNHSVYYMCVDTVAANAIVAVCDENMQIDAATGECVLTCLREGRLPNAHSAQKFYECIQTGTNTFTSPIPKTCPDGSVFSKDSERCVATGSKAQPKEFYFEPSGDPADEEYYKVPKGFMIGSASAAYQIEGAWNDSDKSISIWDAFFHERPQLDNGDVADDSFHKYGEDVDMLSALKMNTYRFSVSWPRVLPDGDAKTHSDTGVEYYNNLIDRLKLANIEPIITVHHWDIPEKYQLEGGWISPSIQDRYVEYADFLFKTFGTKVKYWILMNEPHIFCTNGYETGRGAPGIRMPGTGAYACVHNMLLAHAKAYRLYEKTYKEAQGGLVGTSIDIQYYQPATDSAADVAAADRMTQFLLGWVADPLAFGDYPQIMRDIVDANSKGMGLSTSRLPSFTDEEKALLKGAWDFMGINHYTTLLAHEGSSDPDTTTPSYDNDTAVHATSKAEWTHSERYVFAICPWGIREVLRYIKNKYDNIPVFISENGYAGHPDEKLDDPARLYYHSTYMRAVMRSINEDHCNVIGYTAWCLDDNLEWADGYSMRFGLVYIDYNDPERTRHLKKSSKLFTEIHATGYVPYYPLASTVT